MMLLLVVVSDCSLRGSLLPLLLRTLIRRAKNYTGDKSVMYTTKGVTIILSFWPFGLCFVLSAFLPIISRRRVRASHTLRSSSLFLVYMLKVVLFSPLVETYLKSRGR